MSRKTITYFVKIAAVYEQPSVNRVKRFFIYFSTGFALAAEGSFPCLVIHLV